jgi:antitoxin MazE
MATTPLKAFMHVHLVRIGTSRGIRLPKAILDQAGLQDEVDITVTDGAVVIRPVRSKVRDGWAEAAKECHAQGSLGGLSSGSGKGASLI